MPQRLRGSWALALVLAVGSAAADTRTTQEQFESATKLFDAKDYAGALSQFDALVRETQSPNARFYVAKCHMLLGHLAKAYDEMAATVRDAAGRAATEPKYERTRDAAASELAVLERRVGRLLVTLAAPPAGVAVSINGVPVPPDRLGGAVSVDAGEARVEVTSPGGQRSAQDVRVAPGELRTVFFSFAPPPPPSSAPTPSTSDVPASPPRGRPLRTAAWISAGTSVVGFSVLTVAGLIAREKYRSLQTSCGGARCTDPAKGSDVDAGKSAQTIANVGLVVGLVGAAAGITLWLVDGRAGDGASAALLPGGGYVSVVRGF